MRVCLDCHAEYLDDPPRCRSCGAETVTPEQAALDASLRDDRATEELVVITELEGPVDESIITELLRDAGIPSTVKGGGRGALPGVDHSVDLYGRLLVAEEHAQDAARIVRQYRDSVVIEPPLDEDPADAPTN